MEKLKIITSFIFVFVNCWTHNVHSQGMNYNWLIGNQVLFDTNTTAPRARILFDATNATVIGETRKMAFMKGKEILVMKMGI